MGKIVQYIELNPVAAGLVERAEDWRWSSAFGGAERQAGRPVVHEAEEVNLPPRTVAGEREWIVVHE